MFEQKSNINRFGVRCRWTFGNSDLIAKTNKLIRFDSRLVKCIQSVWYELDVSCEDFLLCIAWFMSLVCSSPACSQHTRCEWKNTVFRTSFFFRRCRQRISTNERIRKFERITEFFLIDHLCMILRNGIEHLIKLEFNHANNINYLVMTNSSKLRWQIEKKNNENKIIAQAIWVNVWFCVFGSQCVVRCYR